MIIASLHEGKKFPVQLTIMRAGNGKFSTSKKKSYSLAKRQARNKRAHCPNFAGFNCCFRQIFAVFLGDSDSYYPVEHCTSANEYFRKLYMARQLGAKSFSNLATCHRNCGLMPPISQKRCKSYSQIWEFNFNRFTEVLQNWHETSKGCDIKRIRVPQ